MFFSRKGAKAQSFVARRFCVTSDILIMINKQMVLFTNRAATGISLNPKNPQSVNTLGICIILTAATRTEGRRAPLLCSL